MTTFNRIYRAPKFHLCVHTGNQDHIGFEPADSRRTQFTFVSYGIGTFHAFTGDDHSVISNTGNEELLDLRKYVGSAVVIKARGNYRIISFNSWRQNEIWQGRLLDKDEVEILSKHLYSTLVCFKGTFKINDKEVPEMTYVELKQNKIYNIDSSSSFVGLFEEGYA